MKTKLYVWRFYLLSFVLAPAFVMAQADLVNDHGTGSVKMLGFHNSSNNNQNKTMGMDESTWIHYDDTELSDSWGFLINGEIYDVMAKWDPEDISDYDGWQITKVKFIVVTSDPIFKVKVWVGPDAEEVYSQNVTTVNVNSWTEVILDTPVTIDAETELYVGYYVDYSASELGGFVTATDDGPPIDEYGNLYRLNGIWYSDFNNHNLQVYIESNLNADFEADYTVICAGSTVNFTNLSTSEETYNWSFEGGYPSTSSEENPSVAYDTPGVYDVTLEVTADNESDTEMKQGYITVLGLPGQAETPEGDESVCTGQSFEYEINPVIYAQDYEWELSPSDAGEIIGDNNSAILMVNEDWTGSFTIRVRAINLCGSGEWSEYFEGTVFASPVFYDLEGGGGYCLNGEGVEITLSDSQSGVEYELYLDGNPTGILLEGTGSEISFGLLTEEGVFTCIANNGTCEEIMNEQVEVFILFPPAEPSTPTGPQVICNESSSVYESEGSDDADGYVWVISPEEAGEITPDGLQATVEWNAEFSGTAAISLYGINDCGEGNPSNLLEVSVGSPNPQIEGESTVCDWSEEVYQVENHDGSVYTWEANGGTLSNGQGSSMVTVLWEGIGSGTLSVSELTADGCEGASELFELIIDDCTGIDQFSPEKFLSVSPSPVLNGNFKLTTGTSSPVKVKILNTDGIVVNEFKTTQNIYPVNFSDYSSGIYLLHATYKNERVYVLKFIKY